MASAPRPRKRERKPRRRGLGAFSFLRALFLLLVYGASAVAAMGYYAVSTINDDLPTEFKQLLDYQPSRRSTVLASDGTEVGSFSIEDRTVVRLERVPPHVIAAFLSAEDRRFYKHGGFDPIGIVRAAVTDLRGGGKIKQGGSTLTQQILKQTVLKDLADAKLDDMGLPPARQEALEKLLKYRRKLLEIVASVRLERELSKADILEIYLNQIPLGHHAYGVAAGAQLYFGKDVEDLTIAEAALLAGVVPAPTKYAPTHDYKLARERQIYVLGHMRDEKYISDTEYQAALAEPIALVDDPDLNHLASPYFVEQVRELATQRYGTQSLFRGGLTFYSTLDAEMQAVAESALKHGLETLDRKLGFRGPVGTVDPKKLGEWGAGHAHPLTGEAGDVSANADRVLPDQTYGAMVVEMPGAGGLVVDLGPRRLPLAEADAREIRAWRQEPPPPRKPGSPAPPPAKFPIGRTVKLGDLLPVRLAADGNSVTLAQRPALQGSMIVIDPHSGRVLALVGGYDWTTSQFDRATQAHRQVGSSIKPFVYSAFLESGKTPVEHMHDGPFSVQTATGVWTPANYDNKYLGDVTLMTALAYSLNTISVQIAVQVGLDRIIEIMRGYGITSPIPRHISIALGTPDLTPLEVAGAYAGIASGGHRVTPRFFDLVTDTATGRVVDDLRHLPQGPQVVSPDVDYVMVNLMKGVVSRGTARYALGLGRPTAGKTGTSANYKDVWFNGFTADLLCSVWIGRDDSTPIGDKITGGGAAVPIWLDFMQKAHPRTKVRDFPVPAGVTFARVEPWGGDPASPGTDGAVWMPFVRGTLPRNFLAAPPPTSFDALVPAPAVPRPAPAVKCSSLSCL